MDLSDFVHVKEIASVVGQITSMIASCGNVTQIMTRYLHLIINSRCSWNSAVFMHDQGKEEVYFWRDKLRTLNGVSFWPAPFVPSKVLFSDASSTGCGAFIQGSSLSLSQKLVRGRVAKVFNMDGTFRSQFCARILW